ncbi:hypothetical protein PIB19_09810 [Sphingomonas sp. 7/4-4]|uniref:hypothetical protein n=1 Tax=Sphingomonas sp. 7/4-4 TaxID=3018446 RepID=UPI0022F390E2|nr:hypothetical protein [Sphingomonas sp. 7/4-4]WBY09559.1 hypothetical protein PIB19_09810 [Sphingomonas sp. 7/4-4]
MKRVGSGSSMDEGAPQGDLIIPIENVPVAAFQAIYHNLTKKTEVLDRNFETKFQIDVAAIQDFHYHFQQLVSQYQVKASRSAVVVALSNGEVHKLSSVEMFSSVNWSSKMARCSHVSLEYDFLIMLPSDGVASDTAQRFKVSISTDRVPVRNSFIVVGPIHKFPTQFWLKSSIEYSDISVARSIQ